MVMKKLILTMSMIFAAMIGHANWLGLTQENYACGPKLSASQLRGKVVLVDMWATWCGPCRMAMPHTVELARKYKSKGLVVIGSHVETGYQRDSVQKLVECENWNTVSFYKEAKWTGDSIGFDGGIPFLYVVNKKGKIIARGRDFAAIEKAIQEELGKVGGAQLIEIDSLSEYKNLEGKIVPGKNVENILKKLKADIEKANKMPESATFQRRKQEAIKIATELKDYKADLTLAIKNAIEEGDKKEAVRLIDIMTSTWPSTKKTWADKRKELAK